MYYWVVDYTADKSNNLHPVIIGGRAFTSELLAQRYMDDSNLSRKAEIFELPTSDVSRATRMVKAQLVKRYKSLDGGMKRAVHKRV